MADIVERLREAATEEQLKLRPKEYLKAADEIDQLRDKHHIIYQWCNTYPLDIFPEPDFVAVQEALAEHGITLDSVSASNMRHVLSCIRKIIDG